MKLLNIYEAVEYDHREYLKWKRKNVTIRGVQNVGQANGGGGMLGLGLYVTPLGNRALAKEYGTVYFLIGAIPKTPLVVNSLNEWEIWSQRNLFMKYSTGKFPDQRAFFKNSTIEGEMQKMGYDGVIIKGREMVNYSPSDDVKYFQNEKQLQMYYEDFIMGKGDNVDEELTYHHVNTEGVDDDDEYEIGMVKEGINYNEFLKYGAHDDLDVNKENLKNLINMFNKLPNTLTLYRVVFLENKNDLNTIQLGSHYVLSKNDLDGSHYTEPHLNSKGQPFILTVKANKNDIDVIETFKYNMQYPNEKEITLKNKGKGVNLISIKQFQSNSFNIGTSDYQGFDDYSF